MKFTGIIVLIILKIIGLENRMLPINYETEPPSLEPVSLPDLTINDNSRESSFGLDAFSSKESEYGLEMEGKITNERSEKRLQIVTQWLNMSIKKYFHRKTSLRYSTEKISTSKHRAPCAIVVLSNIQNPNMQSLLRKYRYDANGDLIPNSVKYFMKLPQGRRSSPVLVPLNDKAFSPLGGFVRYYKEVPPIPQAW